MKPITRILCTTTTAALLCAFLSPPPASAEDWPGWRGPNRNGTTPESDWKAWGEDGPKIAWRKSIGTGFATITVAKGRAFTMGNTGKPRQSDADVASNRDVVWCLDAASGDEIWKHEYPSPLRDFRFEGGPTATPLIVGDRVYTLGRSSDLHCFDAGSGDVIWLKNLKKDYGLPDAEYGYSTTPLWLKEGHLVINGGDCVLVLKAENADLVWRTPTTGKSPAPYSSPVEYELDGKRCLALFQSTEALGVALDGGGIVWRYPWKTQFDLNIADPIVRGDRVFIASGYNHGAALIDIANEGGGVQLVYEARKMRNHFNGCVLYGDQLYGFDENTLKCIDFATGNERWTQDGLGKGSLIVAGDRLVIMGETGHVAIAKASPDGYAELARAEVLSGKCWTSPTLANGRIYVRNALGDAACLDVRGAE